MSTGRPAARRDPLADSVWTRDARAGNADRPDRAGLHRGQIVSAAIDLLDTEGPTGLSMRKLAQRLGAGTTSAYWHVANKGELLDLALDEVMREVAMPEVTPDRWRELLAGYARGFRDLYRRHPWVMTVVGERPLVGPNATRLAEWELGMLRSAGFELRDAAYATSVVSSFALGNAVAENASRTEAAGPALSDAEMMAALARHYEGQRDRYPNVIALLHDYRPADPDAMRDEIFEFGLAHQLDGFALLLDRSGPAGSREGSP